MPYIKPATGSIVSLTGCCAMYVYYGFSFGSKGTIAQTYKNLPSQLSLPNLQEGYGRRGGILATTNGNSSIGQLGMEEILAEAGWRKIATVCSKHEYYPVTTWLMELSGNYPQPSAPVQVVEKVVEVKPKRVRKTDALGRPAAKSVTKAPRKRGPAPLSF